MKHFTFIFIVALCSLTISPNQLLAQRGHGGHGGHGGGHHPHVKAKIVGKQHPNGRVVVVKSRYRPAKLVVFHPVWGPKRAFNRRWVFFPKHNFYWDNWRQMYVYRNGTVWVVNATPPPTVVNINIDNEKHYELKETDDDVDDVYQTNNVHQTEYKSE
ncbi:MAG TPA: hypothetical protein PKZ75_10925 [Bacteroidia bacterium]|nr:hypothetical protein [Bacteroidia bacterium]